MEYCWLVVFIALAGAEITILNGEEENGPAPCANVCSGTTGMSGGGGGGGGRYVTTQFSTPIIFINFKLIITQPLGRLSISPTVFVFPTNVAK